MPVARPAAAPPRTKPPEIRREELMDAAETLFIEKGVSGTSIDDIVAAAGVAKGTFYHHFASKDAMLVALQERFVAGFCTHVQAALDACAAGDWAGRLRAWVLASVEGYFDRLALHDVVFHDFRIQDRGQMNRNAVVDQLEGLLAAGHQARAWSVDSPRLVAIMLFHAMHGACDEAMVDEAVDLGHIADVLHGFCRRAVGLRAGKS